MLQSVSVVFYTWTDTGVGDMKTSQLLDTVWFVTLWAQCHYRNGFEGILFDLDQVTSAIKSDMCECVLTN